MAFSPQKEMHVTAIFVLLCTFTYPAMSQTAYHSSYEYAIAQARARATAAEAQYEASLQPAPAPSESSVAREHERWMAKYGRIYSNQTEKNARFDIFKQNLEYINRFNSAGSSRYWLGLNQFADLTEEEFLASYVGFKGSRLINPPRMAPNYQSSLDCSENGGPWKPVNQSEVPASWDWRDEGAVTHPKDQHPCGLDPFRGDISGFIFPPGIDPSNASNLCRYESYLRPLGNSWAFSAVAAVEGFVKIKTGNLTSLSEQQLMDCADSEDNGENLIDDAFKYIINNKGMATENDYPYQGKTDEICEEKKAAKSAANIKHIVYVHPNSEELLLQAVSQQPVSAVVSFCGALQFYSGGIYSGECGSSPNLAVAVIGYGGSDDQKFWWIKNSWGRSWGMDGYMQLQRDAGTDQGHCGIAMKASYPTA